MVNVPLKKKKKVQVSSPGRATPAPKYKNDERGDVFAFKNFFSPLSKAIPMGLTSLQPQGHHFSHFLIPFCAFVHHQQVSIPSLSFLAFHWCILISFWCSKIVGVCSNIWGNFGLFSCLIRLNWGFVWDGPRPIMHFEAMGHATLSPFSCY